MTSPAVVSIEAPINNIGRDQYNILHTDNADLNQLLDPIPMGHNRGEGVVRCTAGTREDLIAVILRWIYEGGDRPICWVKGPTGFGKSAVSQTVAEICDDHHILAGSFFFSGEGYKIARVIHTLAYQLSVSFPATKPFIQQVLHNDRSIVQLSHSHQFRKLLIEPYLAARDASAAPCVIVFDALDKCSDIDLMVNFIEIVTSACLEDCLFPFQILLTSRVEEHLRKKLEAPTARSIIYPLDLRNFDASDSIHRFFLSQFPRIYGENSMCEQGISWPWPSDLDVEGLVKIAGGSFHNAVKIVDYIDDGTDVPHRKLILALKTKTPRSLQLTGGAQAEPLWTNTPNCNLEAINLEDLIDFLILPSVREWDTFFTTYAAFTTASEVLQCLVHKFRSVQRGTPLRSILIISILRYWVTKPYFKVDPNVLDVMREFATSIQKTSRIARELHSAIAERLISPSRSQTATPSKSIEPSNPEDLAIGLQILEGHKYTRILPADYISYFTQQSGTNHVEDAFNTNNTITHWVMSRILDCHDLQERSRRLCFFVYTAEECRKLCNFASMSAIVTALRDATITSLKLTYGLLPEDAKCKIKEMEYFLDPHDNYSVYMATLKGSDNLHCVPLLAAHIAVMCTAFEATKNTVVANSIPMINFAKWTEFHACVKDLLLYKPPNILNHHQMWTGILTYLKIQLRGNMDQDWGIQSSKTREEESQSRHSVTLGLGIAGFPV